jgi:hypothetical protein
VRVVRTAPALAAAAAIGSILIGLVDLWTAGTTVSLVMLMVLAVAVGAIDPRRFWAYGLAAGLGIPLVQALSRALGRPDSYPGETLLATLPAVFVGLGAALVGAGLGLLVRRRRDARPKRMWRRTIEPASGGRHRRAGRGKL